MPISRGDIGKWDIFRYFVKPIPTNYVSVPIGVGDVFGSEVIVIDARSLGYNTLLITGYYDNVGGTFTTGETLTVRRVAYYADGSKITFDRSYTSTGLRLYGEGMWEVSNLFRNNPLVAVGVMAKTNMGSTSVTLTVAVSGYMI